MTDYDTDVLVSADWVEDHLEAFQSDDPDYRLVELESHGSWATGLWGRGIDRTSVASQLPSTPTPAVSY